MKTILVLWLISGGNLTMTTRGMENEAQCETAGQAWERLTEVGSKHRYACLPTVAMH